MSARDKHWSLPERPDAEELRRRRLDESGIPSGSSTAAKADGGPPEESDLTDAEGLKARRREAVIIHSAVVPSFHARD